jgi:HEAT repeat protein
MAQTELERLIAIARDRSRSEDERTTAIHALGRQPVQQSIPYLLELMRDDALAVRWAAAATLRKYGQEMLGPLLRALATQPADHRFYESAHHALTRFGNPAIETILDPVLEALAGSGAAAAVPAAAMDALEKLESAS